MRHLTNDRYVDVMLELIPLVGYIGLSGVEYLSNGGERAIAITLWQAYCDLIDHILARVTNA